MSSFRRPSLLGALAGLASIAFFFLSAPEAGAQTEVHLRLQRSGIVRVNLVLSDIEGASDEPVLVEMGHVVREILRNDLDFSTLFRVSDLGSGPPSDDERDAVIARLKKDGQDALVTGRLHGTAREMVLDAAIIEVQTGRVVSQETVAVSRDRVRYAAHTLADKIVLQLAGERGIARSRIAFVSTRGGTREIYAMDYDGHDIEEVTRNGSINLSPTWLDGTHLLSLVSYLGGDPDLYLLDLRNPKLVPLSSNKGLESSPDYSPASGRVAFTMAREGNPDIYVADLKGGKLGRAQRLTQHPGVDCCPSWSPNGLEIAFVSDRSGTPQVYVMEADGSNLRRLTFQGNYNAEPAWSPRGERIAFASRGDGGFDIFTVSPSGFALEQVTFGDRSYEAPAWSPDGRHLAVNATGAGRSSIYVISEGGGIRRLTTGSGDDTAPAWSYPPAEAESEWSAGRSAAPPMDVGAGEEEAKRTR